MPEIPANITGKPAAASAPAPAVPRASPAAVRRTDQLLEARTAKEGFQAQLRHLELQRRAGRLVPVDAVARSMERCGAALVRDIDRLPIVAEDIAAAFQAGGVQGVRAALRRVARNLRKTLGDNMRLLAEGESVDE